MSDPHGDAAQADYLRSELEELRHAHAALRREHEIVLGINANLIEDAIRQERRRREEREILTRYGDFSDPKNMTPQPPSFTVARIIGQFDGLAEKYRPTDPEH